MNTDTTIDTDDLALLLEAALDLQAALDGGDMAEAQAQLAFLGGGLLMFAPVTDEQWNAAPASWREAL